MAGLRVRFPFQRFFILGFHDQLVKKNPHQPLFLFKYLKFNYCAPLLQTEIAVHQNQANSFFIALNFEHFQTFMISHPILMIWFSIVLGDFEKLRRLTQNLKGSMFYVDSKEEINTTNEEIYASSKRKENCNGWADARPIGRPRAQPFLPLQKTPL